MWPFKKDARKLTEREQGTLLHLMYIMRYDINLLANTIKRINTESTKDPTIEKDMNSLVANKNFEKLFNELRKTFRQLDEAEYD